MKNSLKKLLFVILTVFSVIFIGACGKSKINKEEVIGKFVEASKNMKSADMLMDIKMVQKESKETMINVSIDTTMILEPLEMRFEMTIPDETAKILMYAKEGYIYVLDPISNQWMKEQSTDLTEEQFKDYMANLQYISDVMKDNIDKIDVDEKNGDYIISVSKKSEFLKDTIKKQLSDINTIGSQIGDQVEVNNIAVNYILDKNTYMTKNSTISFDLEVSGQKISVEMVTKFSNINEIKEIAFPEEAKNAQEMKANQ